MPVIGDGLRVVEQSTMTMRWWRSTCGAAMPTAAGHRLPRLLEIGDEGPQLVVEDRHGLRFLLEPLVRDRQDLGVPPWRGQP